MEEAAAWAVAVALNSLLSSLLFLLDTADFDNANWLLSRDDIKLFSSIYDENHHHVGRKDLNTAFDLVAR